jgi:hypothetical protein
MNKMKELTAKCWVENWVAEKENVIQNTTSKSGNQSRSSREK